MQKMSKLTSSNLIQSLKQLQSGFGWSQAKMAQEIGISTSLLSQVYSGKKILGYQTIKGVAVRFPELQDSVLEALQQ